MHTPASPARPRNGSDPAHPVGDGDGVGGGKAGGEAGGAVPGKPGGSQSPFTQTQSDAGRGLVQPVGAGGVGVGGVGVGGAGGGGAGGVVVPGKPGGSQPPFTHTQSDAGCGVVHPVDGGVGVGGGGGVGSGVGEVVPGKPGGSQLPFTQTQSGAGCTVGHGLVPEPDALMVGVPAVWFAITLISPP